MVVEGDPAWQGVEPMPIGSVGPGIGPLGEEGLDEPLRLAVGLGPVRAGAPVADTEALERSRVAAAPVGVAVSVSARSMRMPWAANQALASSSAAAAERGSSPSTRATKPSRLRSSMSTSRWSYPMPRPRGTAMPRPWM
jgi:hypothetical protein